MYTALDGRLFLGVLPCCWAWPPPSRSSSAPRPSPSPGQRRRLLGLAGVGRHRPRHLRLRRRPVRHRRGRGRPLRRCADRRDRRPRGGHGLGGHHDPDAAGAGHEPAPAPLFSWSMLVGGTVWLLVLPVVAAGLLLAYVDLRGSDGFLGGPAGLYNRIAWLFWQPALRRGGARWASSPTSCRCAAAAPAPQGRHGAARPGRCPRLRGVGPVGRLLDGGTPAPWLQDGPWNVVSYLAVIPVVGLLLLWTATLGTGRVRLGTLIVAVFAGLLVFLGVAGGVATAIESLDLDGTTWMTAQALLVCWAPHRWPAWPASRSGRPSSTASSCPTRWSGSAPRSCPRGPGGRRPARRRRIAGPAASGRRQLRRGRQR